MALAYKCLIILVCNLTLCLQVSRLIYWFGFRYRALSVETPHWLFLVSGISGLAYIVSFRPPRGLCPILMRLGTCSDL
ncbi:hypothetical protein L211DRAFT_832823 [Terfezia boudieri ATCC MYA-4762]|uniref:Uncharacterized protein n=1 Tax=Terfezia boudieri ATCC MYA-4762 TaxID=1051890 RepID=A0A3N4M192_9PEZI|nr:hypothetical protein L211DRAFT_832823 [Terfezia boudieri ATCC MYA-4762]